MSQKSADRNGFVTAKYVNSPETPIFQKSKLLYGFWKSKDAIREAKAAVLVEGQMDFLMSYQSGVRNVIASSRHGSAYRGSLALGASLGQTRSCSVLIPDVAAGLVMPHGAG